MLPFEIYTLVFLSTAALAVSQSQDSGDSSNSTRPSKARPTSVDLVRVEWTVSGFSADTTIPITHEIPKVGITETPETGFERTAGEQQESTPAVIWRPPLPATDIVVTTRIPTIIGIRTEYSVGRPPPPSTQSTPDNGLLDDIISRIGNPPPGAQPTQGPNGGGNENTGHELQTAPSLTETPGIQAPLSVNERITLGSTTLNLTPGLSTIIGVGTSATLVAMTTNVAGQTIIVISSSGTAISATVTKTAVVYTAPRTGFDAILTAAAKPADNWNRNTAGSPTSTTASKGGAAQRWNDRTEWWAGVLFGLGVVFG